MVVKHILVFGSLNAGKTSVLNALTGHLRPVNNTAEETGESFETTSYELVTKDNTVYHFFGTDGLCQTNKATLTFDKALDNIENLLTHSANGFNLLVFVRKSVPITQIDKDEYDMFVHTVANNRVPVICVVTGCEEEEPMQKWVENNASTFKSSGMVFAEMIATCFRAGGRFEKTYEQLRAESAKNVWKAVIEKSADKPFNFIADAGGHETMAEKMWSNYSKWLSRGKWKKQKQAAAAATVSTKQ